jgi:hypothetical protein
MAFPLEKLSPTASKSAVGNRSNFHQGRIRSELWPHPEKPSWKIHANGNWKVPTDNQFYLIIVKLE